MDDEKYRVGLTMLIHKAFILLGVMSLFVVEVFAIEDMRVYYSGYLYEAHYEGFEEEGLKRFNYYSCEKANVKGFKWDKHGGHEVSNNKTHSEISVTNHLLSNIKTYLEAQKMLGYREENSADWMLYKKDVLLSQQKIVGVAYMIALTFEGFGR